MLFAINQMTNQINVIETAVRSGFYSCRARDVAEPVEDLVEKDVRAARVADGGSSASASRSGRSGGRAGR